MPLSNEQGFVPPSTITELAPGEEREVNWQILLLGEPQRLQGFGEAEFRRFEAMLIARTYGNVEYVKRLSFLVCGYGYPKLSHLEEAGDGMYVTIWPEPPKRIGRPVRDVLLRFIAHLRSDAQDLYEASGGTLSPTGQHRPESGAQRTTG